MRDHLYPLLKRKTSRPHACACSNVREGDDQIVWAVGSVAFSRCDTESPRPPFGRDVVLKPLCAA